MHLSPSTGTGLFGPSSFITPQSAVPIQSSSSSNGGGGGGGGFVDTLARSASLGRRKEPTKHDVERGFGAGYNYGLGGDDSRSGGVTESNYYYDAEGVYGEEGGGTGSAGSGLVGGMRNRIWGGKVQDEEMGDSQPYSGAGGNGGGGGYAGGHHNAQAPSVLPRLSFSSATKDNTPNFAASPSRSNMGPASSIPASQQPPPQSPSGMSVTASPSLRINQQERFASHGTNITISPSDAFAQPTSISPPSTSAYAPQMLPTGSRNSSVGEVQVAPPTQLNPRLSYGQQGGVGDGSGHASNPSSASSSKASFSPMDYSPTGSQNLPCLPLHIAQNAANTSIATAGNSRLPPQPLRSRQSQQLDYPAYRSMSSDARINSFSGQENTDATISASSTGGTTVHAGDGFKLEDKSKRPGLRPIRDPAKDLKPVLDTPTAGRRADPENSGQFLSVSWNQRSLLVAWHE